MMEKEAFDSACMNVATNVFSSAVVDGNVGAEYREKPQPSPLLHPL
jgi:hypothetical protein